jgi:hypothetical protein
MRGNGAQLYQTAIDDLTERCGRLALLPRVHPARHMKQWQGYGWRDAAPYPPEAYAFPDF